MTNVTRAATRHRAGLGARTGLLSLLPALALGATVALTALQAAKVPHVPRAPRVDPLQRVGLKSSGHAEQSNLHPGSDPSGVAMPKGNLPGWKQVFSDDFATSVPLGGF